MSKWLPKTSISAVERVPPIDLLRGLAIALMALDHVRDYFHADAYLFDPLDPSRSRPLLYATRWVTHLCAPTFVLLAGVSIWLQLERGKSLRQLSLLLLTRGLWLVVLELTIVQVGWTFTWGMPFLQVIWAIGWSMVILAGLIWLPRLAVLALGVAVIAGHNLLDSVQSHQLGALSDAWIVLLQGGFLFRDSQPWGLVLYSIVPWLAVMSLGYGLGPVFTAPERQRNRMLVLLGAGLIALFFALRLIDHYGDPRQWTEQASVARSVMAFLAVSKYPPSLDYVCATLGLIFLLFPLITHWRGPASAIFRTYGSVPLFAYVLNIYLMHGLQVLAALATGRDPSFTIDFVRNMFVASDKLAGTGFPLPVVYIVWITVLAILYPLCRWWAAVKREQRGAWWLSYV
jgi:uncharacterized membrane protein